MDLFTPTPAPRQSHCPYKGTASYWSLAVGDAELADALWGCETPLPEALLTLARHYTTNIGSVKDASWQAALDAGWSDQQVTELSAHVTLNLLTNYFNHFVETNLDLPAAPEL